MNRFSPKLYHVGQFLACIDVGFDRDARIPCAMISNLRRTKSREGVLQRAIISLDEEHETSVQKSLEHALLEQAKVLLFELLGVGIVELSHIDIFFSLFKSNRCEVYFLALTQNIKKAHRNLST